MDPGFRGIFDSVIFASKAPQQGRFPPQRRRRRKGQKQREPCAPGPCQVKVRRQKILKRLHSPDREKNGAEHRSGQYKHRYAGPQNGGPRNQLRQNGGKAGHRKHQQKHPHKLPVPAAPGPGDHKARKGREAGDQGAGQDIEPWQGPFPSPDKPPPYPLFLSLRRNMAMARPARKTKRARKPLRGAVR